MVLSFDECQDTLAGSVAHPVISTKPVHTSGRFWGGEPKRAADRVAIQDGASPDVIDYGYRCHSFKEFERVLDMFESPPLQVVD